MIRLILLTILILFVVWVLRPFFKTKGSNKAKNTADRIFNSDKSSRRQYNTTLIIITAVILLALVFWLLPKLGISFFVLLQKIIPILPSLRGILPF